MKLKDLIQDLIASEYAEEDRAERMVRQVIEAQSLQIETDIDGDEAIDDETASQIKKTLLAGIHVDIQE